MTRGSPVVTAAQHVGIPITAHSKLGLRPGYWTNGVSDILQDAAVAAAQYEATAFAARYPADPPNVQFISFADVQKGIVANATQLGFIDTTNPWCVPLYPSGCHFTELTMYVRSCKGKDWEGTLTNAPYA